MHDLLISAINLKEAPLLALTPLLCLDAKGKTEEGRRRRRTEEKRREERKCKYKALHKGLRAAF